MALLKQHFRRRDGATPRESKNHQEIIRMYRPGTPLTGLRGMDMVLDQQTWICLDRTFYDLPVLAWTDFEPTARTGLQDPVTCRILYYHVHADFIVHSVLSTTVHALRERAAHMARASDRPADTFGPRVISLSTHPEDFRA